MWVYLIAGFVAGVGLLGVYLVSRAWTIAMAELLAWAVEVEQRRSPRVRRRQLPRQLELWYNRR
jgi:hypothetical protein